ncbi:hypothetical protein U0039_21875 [Stenotrophomonas maltophilia]|nr:MULTISPECIES: hypothetical protein [Stenotrophomonas]AIL07478.1 hypothetical protein DP16_3977 [Stenotrophomonas maltophilia]AVH92371.1 hypothetical protein AL480_16670 [Stenotrophomonas maltophilia]ELC7363779.1 hypothetical protein [Stenotrophomonas maltophilia]KOO72750.1 hypothetical protein VK66_08985 [Stenotrophomonas maltophilia]MBN5036542.1 hypothetical protein [Stenotrophomonas maltophilia]
MKSLRQATPPVSELSLDGLGINFEDDEWFLRRNVIDGIVETRRLDFSCIPDGWKVPIKIYLALAMLGRLERSTRYALVLYERFIVLRSFAVWCYEEGVDSPSDLSPELICPWTDASRAVGRVEAGATRMRAKFICVEDFLLNVGDVSAVVRAEMVRVGKRMSKEASVAAKKRKVDDDLSEQECLMLLADAIKLIEEDGPTIEAFMGEVMAIEAGRLCSAGRRMNSFYIAKRSLPFNGFRSKALAKLDPRVGYGEQIMLKIAEGAAIFIISLLSSMRPSESRRLTTASVKPSNALGMPAGAETSDLIEGVLSKSGRPHEWVAAPAVSDAIAFLERLGRPIRDHVGTAALFVLNMYRGRGPAEARDDQRGARVDGYVALRRSMRAFAEASIPGLDSEKLNFRPLRRFMARFIARRDRSSLGALAYQYGHLEARITDTYYVGLDRDLSTLLEEENANEVVSAMDDLISAEHVYTNLPTPVIAESISRMNGVLERASTNLEVMRMLGAGVVLGPCDWGYCFYREARSRCDGDANGPNPGKRTPSTCAGCLNFTATAKHAPWWELRRQDLISFLKLRGIPEQSRRIAEERLASTELILKKIGSSL